MEPWSHWKAWWLDILKFAVTFLIGAILTIMVLHEIEEARSIRSFQWRKSWERDLEVLEGFRKASLFYVKAAEAALAEVSRGPEGEDVREWRGRADDQFLLSLEEVELRFGRRAPQVTELIKAMKEKYRMLYEEYLRLRRRHDEHGAYIWSDTLTELSRLRLEMAVQLERIIDQPPRSTEKLGKGKIESTH